MKIASLALICIVALAAGCATSTEYKSQAYAKLQTEKTMEYDYDVVWKGIKEALSEFRLEEANQEQGKVVTEWAYSTSNQKYVEVTVNNLPRRKYLQSRYKYEITAKRQIIGVLVSVRTLEEVENISSDGTFKGWQEVDEAERDTQRAHDMLENIERKILGGRHV